MGAITGRLHPPLLTPRDHENNGSPFLLSRTRHRDHMDKCIRVKDNVLVRPLFKRFYTVHCSKDPRPSLHLGMFLESRKVESYSIFVRNIFLFSNGFLFFRSEEFWREKFLIFFTDRFLAFIYNYVREEYLLKWRNILADRRAFSPIYTVHARSIIEIPSYSHACEKGVQEEKRGPCKSIDSRIIVISRRVTYAK